MHPYGPISGGWESKKEEKDIKVSNATPRSGIAEYISIFAKWIERVSRYEYPDD